MRTPKLYQATNSFALSDPAVNAALELDPHISQIDIVAVARVKHDAIAALTSLELYIRPDDLRIPHGVEAAALEAAGLLDIVGMVYAFKRINRSRVVGLVVDKSTIRPIGRFVDYGQDLTLERIA